MISLWRVKQTRRPALHGNQEGNSERPLQGEMEHVCQYITVVKEESGEKRGI